MKMNLVEGLFLLVEQLIVDRPSYSGCCGHLYIVCQLSNPAYDLWYAGFEEIRANALVFPTAARAKETLYLVEIDDIVSYAVDGVEL